MYTIQGGQIVRPVSMQAPSGGKSGSGIKESFIHRSGFSYLKLCKQLLLVFVILFFIYGVTCSPLRSLLKKFSK